MLFYAILAAILTVTSYGQTTTCDATNGNADCEANQDGTVVCFDGGMIQYCTTSCTAQTDCFGVYACVNGGCGICQLSSDCGTGNTCSNMLCQFACDTSNGDNDCSGYLLASKCGSSGYCVGCTGDVDCSTGETCDLDTSMCIPPGCTSNDDCGTGETCDLDNSVCIGESCSANDDCGTGQICDTGNCIDEPCTSNDDCAAGEVCDTGDCGPDMSCRTNSDCTLYGDTCGGLLSVEKPVGLCYISCVTDTDCGVYAQFGLTCDDASAIMPCTNCKGCFGTTSCTIDGDCSTLFDDSPNGKCDTNTNVCYFSCENESDCVGQLSGTLTCYDDPTLGFKRCVPGITKRLSDVCVTDSDCSAPKNKCFDGTTLNVPNMCYVGCSGNGDCESPETCNTDTSTGFTRCSSSCSVDGDCLTGQTCLLGSCYLECMQDNDCTSGGMDAVCETISETISFCDGKRTPPPTPRPSVAPSSQTPAPVTVVPTTSFIETKSGSNKHVVFWVIMIGLSIFSFM